MCGSLVTATSHFSAAAAHVIYVLDNHASTSLHTKQRQLRYTSAQDGRCSAGCSLTAREVQPRTTPYISPGKPADKPAVDAARVQATAVEDEEDIIEAMRLDEQEDVMLCLIARARMAMMRAGGVGGIAAPPSYAQVPLQFGSLQSFGEA